jgi:hypothetical protein
LTTDSLDWRVSSYTGSQGNCVEVAAASRSIHVRDTKDRKGPALAFTSDEWDAFLSDVMAPGLDR